MAHGRQLADVELGDAVIRDTDAMPAEDAIRSVLESAGVPGARILLIARVTVVAR